MYLWPSVISHTKKAECLHTLLFSKTGNVLLRSTPTFAFSSLRCPVLHAFLWKAKRARCSHILLFSKTGNVLFSQAASRQVSSALGSLTSVFEMGTGGSSPPLSPDHI